MRPDELADRYFAAVRARDIDGWIALFAEGARFELPDGREFVGVAAIRAVQAAAFEANPPFPTPGKRIVGDGAIAVEVEARLRDGSSVRTVNMFTLDGGGRIERLNVYRKV